MPSAQDLRIVFFGTPDFAVASLKALVDAGCNVVAAVTAPDKPAGRGLQLQQTAVKQYALSRNIAVLQPPKLKAPGFQEALQALNADLQIVVAFRMLPETVWSMPPLGTVNVHASLLPQYRGAAPINWAIINGEHTTGVTTFKLQHEIDTGNILMQQPVAITPDETAGGLYEKLMAAGASLLIKTVQGLAAGTLTGRPQADIDAETLHHAPKIFKEDTRINWQQSARQVYDFIRGMAPYPAAFTMLDGKMLKIYTASIAEGEPLTAPGNYNSDGKTYLHFATTAGWINALEIQQEGKKRMDIAAFLRGYKLQGL